MGVNCSIYLPPYVRIDDVARIIGICAGFPAELQAGGFLEVKKVKVKTTFIVEMANIILDNGHSCFYHFESGHDKGCPCLSPSSTPVWIAIGNRLVEFFGGELIPNDCTDKNIRILPWKEKIEVSPENDPEWTGFYNGIKEIKPITKEEVKQYEKIAGYPEDEFWGKEIKKSQSKTPQKKVNIKTNITCPVCNNEDKDDSKITIHTCKKCKLKFRD